MKKYYPKKLIEKEGKGVFSDIRILLTVSGATLLALLLPIFLYAPLMQVYRNQHASALYIFGTLETANGQIFDRNNWSRSYIAQQEHAAGVGVAQMTIAWKDYETSDG